MHPYSQNLPNIASIDDAISLFSSCLGHHIGRMTYWHGNLGFLATTFLKSQQRLPYTIYGLLLPLIPQNSVLFPNSRNFMGTPFTAFQLFWLDGVTNNPIWLLCNCYCHHFAALIIGYRRIQKLQLHLLICSLDVTTSLNFKFWFWFEWL